MRLLLDTHFWIWNDLEPWRLTSNVQAALADLNNELWLSPVSIWELGVLLEKGRIRLRDEFHQWIGASIGDLQLQEAALSWEVAAELSFTRLPHRDPGDRFLVATAKVFGLTLVTADEGLIETPGLKILANR
jgi:PIN domain nuclease of toxin-antitoxin system